MGTPVPDSKTPVFVALAAVAVGIVLAAIQGITHGSLAGGIDRRARRDPRVLRHVEGHPAGDPGHARDERDGGVVALGVGGVLIVLRVIYWVA